MNEQIGELNPPDRLMLTPGPSSVHPRVYRAMSSTLVGHNDPWFIHMVMNEVQVLLRSVFRTENRITFPISAAGSGGIEASMVNPLEEGDEALICVNGSFSQRMAEIAERARARVTQVTAPWGRIVDPEDVRRAGKGKKFKILGVTHGESSTTVANPIEEYRQVADELGAILVVDCVSTLAGMPVDVDGSRLDICFSGSQKALGTPPGLSPITVGPRAEEILRSRKTKVQSWYFDLTTTMKYWGKERTYHHTPPISIIYAFREALRMIMEEGLEAGWERHRSNHHALVVGLEAMGLKLFVTDPAHRMITVTAIEVPEAVDAKQLQQQLLADFDIEIAGGLGPLKGKIWRVGIMGYTSRQRNVLLLLAALEKALTDQGYRVPAGAGVAAAIHAYSETSAAAALK
ncbi:MAG TPA: alanine--glyoxylate aminotransferase family protein [Patescibacteria group bacterium]|nr:alanine--glyoxylate aminotransferase family protein [Patescibacteria group bacterium]